MATSFNILPSLTRVDTIQISISLALFTFTSISLENQWLGLSYLITNATILVLSLSTIIFGQNIKLLYLYGYCLFVSIILDIGSIASSWPYSRFYVVPFIFTILLIVFKVFASFIQIQLAKIYNNEPRLPISIDGLFDSPQNTNSSGQPQAQSQSQPPRPLQSNAGPPPYQSTTTTTSVSYQNERSTNVTSKSEHDAVQDL